MQNIHSAAVYRICAGAEKTWNVFRDSSVLPLASFEDKNAALTYAMCMARGQVSWQTLLEGGGKIAPRNAILKYSRYV
jgi:hypothetical protein